MKTRRMFLTKDRPSKEGDRSNVWSKEGGERSRREAKTDQSRRSDRRPVVSRAST